MSVVCEELYRKDDEPAQTRGRSFIQKEEVEVTPEFTVTKIKDGGFLFARMEIYPDINRVISKSK